MLETLAARYHHHLTHSILPFWDRYSLDPRCGGQFTCLTREGSVYDSRKYVWMQGRAAWMYCRLYNRLEPRPEWKESAGQILRFLRRYGVDETGHVYFSLTREGVPAGIQRKPYAAFFLALALIEWYRTGAGSEEDLSDAAAWLTRIQAWIEAPALLGRPSLPGQVPVRQLADVMVLASLALELHAVSPQERYAALMHQCLREARQHWLPSRRTLLENLPLDGSNYADSPDTRLLCPGSAIEVAWFLWHVVEAIGETQPETEEFLCEVIEGSLEYGWDREHGGLFYFMDAEGLPPLALEASMKLWWPHTEAIYALVLAYTKTRDDKWLKWLERVDEYSFRTFADEQYGEWYGYCDRQGNPTTQAKGAPYKGFFHVPRFLLQSIERLRPARS